MAGVADGIYRDPVSGQIVQVKGGLVQLEKDGVPYEQTIDLAGKDIVSGGFAPASPAAMAKADKARAKAKMAAAPLGDQLAAAHEKVVGAVGQAAGDIATGWGTAAEQLATGVYEGAGAVPLAAAAYVEGKLKDRGITLPGPSVKEFTGEGMAAHIGGKEYAAARAQRAAEHPYEAASGELAGQTLGAMAAAPAAGAEAGLGKVGGTLAKVAYGGLEGAGFGGSAAAEQAYIQNTDLSGEKQVAAMGPMALLGSGAALAGVGASRLFNRMGSRAGASVDSPVLTTEVTEPGKRGFWQRFSNERIGKSTGARGQQFQRLAHDAEGVTEMVQKIGDDVKATRLKDGRRVFPETEWEAAKMSGEDFAQRLKTGADEAGERLGAFRKKVWAHAEISDAYRGKPAFDMDGFIREAEREILEPLRKSVFDEHISEAANLGKKLDAIKSLGESPTLEQLSAQRRMLRDIFQPAKPSGGGLPAQPPPGAANLEKLERTLERHIELATDKVAATMPEAKAGEYLALKSKFHTLRAGADLAERAVNQDYGNRVFSLTDNIVGGAGAVAGGVTSGGVGAAVGGIATGIAAKFVRERSSAVMAVLAERLSKNLDGRITASIGRALSAKLPEVAAAAGKFPARTSMLAAFTQNDETPRAAFVRHAREVYRANDPVQATQAMARNLGPLYSHAPQTAQAATATVNRAAAYLATKIPAKAVEVNVFSPTKRESNISDQDLHAFATAWATVNDPLSILDDMERGMLTQGQVDAVKAVYPQLYQHIQGKALEALSKQKEPPPYNMRSQLDLLLGLNGAGEPSLAPAFQRVLAGIGKAQEQLAQEQRPAPSSTPAASAAQHRTLSQGIAVQ